MTEILRSITEPVHALPLDLFRALAGLVAFEYFRRGFVSTPDFASPDGLIDHTLCQRLFPPTRLSLFQDGMPQWFFRVVFALSCGVSLFVVVGYHPRPAAAFLFVIAVSTYRWNVLVAYVDDAIVHLVLAWLVLLPVGTTLDAPSLGNGGLGQVLGAWSQTVVPGLSVRLFLANLALVYLTSGLYKFTSPLWRRGTALGVVLRLPIGRSPDRWPRPGNPMLRLASYWVLVMEPLFALMFVLPDHSAPKWSIVLMAAAFHLGIVVTLRIPFANLAMLGALPIVLGPEIMATLSDPTRVNGSTPAGSPALAATDFLGLLLVASLTLMILWEVVCRGRWSNIPLWKDRLSVNPVCAALWTLGIAQSYRLFDWIDQRNYHVRYEVYVSDDAGHAARVPADCLFPRSVRHLLLQSYVFGNIWLQMGPDTRNRIAESILSRYADRYAKNASGAGRVEAFSVLQRITPENFDLRNGRKRLLLRFAFANGASTIDYSGRGD